MTIKRETFSSNFGLLMSMIGVAVGLGNMWRFPYMVGKFGGAAFVIFYLAMVFLVGIPALMAEWTLGRYTRRGTLGAFSRGGLPGGTLVGGFLVFIMFCGTAYYNNTLGWVGYYALSQLAAIVGVDINPATILPPTEGFDANSLYRQLAMTAIVLTAAALVLTKGLKKGIEKASKFIIPSLFIIIIVLIIRGMTLPGAGAGLKWYLGDFSFDKLTGSVMAAALGHTVFSLSLGGTMMLVYGSYMSNNSSIPKNSIFTALGDSIAGLMAGLAVFPAVFAFGLEPSSGPSLIFMTLPKTFAAMPAGAIFGFLFFAGLFGAAYLSVLAAFEVLVTALTDNMEITRKEAVWISAVMVMLLAIPSMINMEIFVPWDLIFGSGMQTLGALLAVITAAWCIKRSEMLKEIARGTGKSFPLVLYWWMRVVIPLAVLFVGINWLLESVFKVKIFG